MTTTDPTRANDETDAPPPASKAPKGSRSYSVSLTGAEGATLKITAMRKKDGSATMHATHSTKAAGGKRQNQRAATEPFPSLERAKAAVEKLPGEAVKRGWVRPERRSGFTAKPDALSAANLPGPESATKANKKEVTPQVVPTTHPLVHGGGPFAVYGRYGMRGRGVVWPVFVGVALALLALPFTWLWKQVRDR